MLDTKYRTQQSERGKHIGNAPLHSAAAIISSFAAVPASSSYRSMDCLGETYGTNTHHGPSPGPFCHLRGVRVRTYMIKTKKEVLLVHSS